MKTNFLRAFCASVVAVFTTVASVQATLIEYGNFDGDDVMFIDVTEETTPDADPGYFGEPTVANNSLDFDPTTFKSLSSGDESGIVDSQFSAEIMSIDGAPIVGLWISEHGDYALVGPEGAAAEVTVSIPAVNVEILEVDGVAAVVPDLMAAGDMATFSLAADGVGSEPWWLMAEVDIAGHLADNGIAGDATKINVTFDNTLTSASANGGSAFIAKKDATIEVHVPEPATFSLMAFGLLGLLGVARRRRSA